MEMNSPNCYMSQVCRTCLQQISDDASYVYVNTRSTGELTTIRDKLMDILPGINLSLTPNAVLCCSCVGAIEFVYKYKKRCLLTEKYIIAYIHETVNSVDLSQIIPNQNIDVIDLDKINTTEYLEEIEVKDNIFSGGKFFEDFPENEQLSISYSNNQQSDQVVSQNQIEIQPHEITDPPVFNTDYVPSTLNADKEENNDDTAIREKILTEQTSISPNHMQTYEEYECVTHEKDSSIKHVRTYTRKNMKHRCTKCNFSTTCKESLKVHIKSHTSQTAYNCKECSYQSNHEGHFNRHIRTHAVYNNQHRCSECDYGCKHDGTLTVHKIAHAMVNLSRCLDEKLFKCRECDYGCNRKGKLKHHIKIHKQTERPRSCDV